MALLLARDMRSQRPKNSKHYKHRSATPEHQSPHDRLRRASKSARKRLIAPHFGHAWNVANKIFASERARHAMSLPNGSTATAGYAAPVA